MIEPREINADTVNALIALAVKTSQMRLVASNAITIAQAAYQPGAWLRGLWLGNTPVGLLAMIDLDHPSVTLDEGAASEAWTYIYNWPVTNLPRIASGRFLEK